MQAHAWKASRAQNITKDVHFNMNVLLVAQRLKQTR